MVRKVDLWTKKESPPAQIFMANKLGVCKRTVQKIIKKYLNRVVKRKAKVHALTPKHKQNRKTNARKLYERHLAGQKSEFVVSLDEAWFYVQDCQGERKLCYRGLNEPPPNFVFQKPEKFGEKFMVVGALTGRGVVPLFKVPPNVKINSTYYIDHVLKPLIEVYLPRIYPGEMNKVFIHHDAASSHTSRLTTQYAEEVHQKTGITIINKSQIPVKSPDGSPMDFYGFGLLKQRLHFRKASTAVGVWKVLQDEWNKITPQQITKVIDSWKRRLRLISQRHGEHIEQTKEIHKRKV